MVSLGLAVRTGLGSGYTHTPSFGLFSAGSRQAKARITVANAPIIDISTVDLTVDASGEYPIDALLPQTGDMRMLDRVCWMGPDGLSSVGYKDVRSDEFWCAGHIPGRPLFPGVMMIEAAAQLCSYTHKRTRKPTGFLGFIRCDEVSFRGQVVPGDRFVIAAKELSFNARLFKSLAQGFVHNKMVFEGLITGMVI